MRTSRRLSAVAVILLVAATVVVAAGKPAPPVKLAGMFKKLIQAEEELEARNWDGVRQAVNSIADQFGQIKGSLAEVVPRKTLDGFSEDVAGLMKASGARDPKAFGKAHIALQGSFLDTMDHFSFEVPPVITVIGRYLGIAEEASEKDDFGVVVHEMEEIASFGSRLRKAAKEKGARPELVDKFDQKVKEVRLAAEGNKKEAVRAGLKELKHSLQRL